MSMVADVAWVRLGRFTWPESPPAMQEHAMTNGFDSTFSYQMAAPLISG